VRLQIPNLLPSRAVETDPGSFQSAVLHLIHNAVQAMIDAHTVSPTIEVSCRTEEGMGNGCFIVVVQDNGPGIPPEALDCMERGIPYSKKEGHYGRGLLTVKEFADRYCELEIESDKAGSKVSLIFPAR